MSAISRFNLRFLLLVGLLAGLCSMAAIAHGKSANYCDPLAGCKHHFVKVSPNPATAGKSVTVSGKTGHRCTAIIYSKAFKGARHKFAGQPALHVKTNSKGRFSTKFKLSAKLKAGKYHVGGRCAGGKFGSTTLKVKK
jgi:hypothetical protein